MGVTVSVGRKLLFSMATLIIAAVGLELVARAAYFQIVGRKWSAVAHGIQRAKRTLAERSARNVVDDLELPDDLQSALYSSDGRDLLEEFRQTYRGYFLELEAEVRSVGAEMLVIYITAGDYDLKSKIRQADAQFLSRLCAESGVLFVDMNQYLLQHSPRAIMLIPEDRHLSRFGNQIVAQHLAAEISNSVGDHRSTFSFSHRPRLFGDHSPNTHRILALGGSHPYRASINSQGLRMDHDLAFPKTRQRILLLGDSFTFGHPANDGDNFAHYLQERLPDSEIVNAGVNAMTISDELSLFRERAKYVEPDVVVLQVLDNDFENLFSFYRNIFDRDGARFSPSEAEQSFIERLRGRSRLAADL